MTRLLLIALPIVSAFAQQAGPATLVERQASAEATRLMRSPGYREKAWGAYLVGQYVLTERAGDVRLQLAGLAELAANTLRGDTPEYSVVQATLDALIRVGDRPDAGLLLPFERQFPDEVLILLSQDVPANREMLLAMTEQQDTIGARWVAANNLLVEARSAGIAARLLAELNISHVFYVTDGSGYGPGEGGGTGGGALCCGMRSPSADLPPAGIYQLVLSAERSDVLAAPGKHPVYYRRVTTCRGASLVDVDRQEYRLEYLAELSGLPLGAIKQAAEATTSIQWSNASAYRSQVAAALTAQRAAIGQVLESLEAGDVLGRDEAEALQLRILIDQEDQRKMGEALPSLLPVPVN